MELNPYIMFNGTCKEALQFYKEALGGEIGQISTFGGLANAFSEKDKGRVMHATFLLGSAIIMASDAMPDQPVPKVSNIHLSINFKDVPTMEEKYEKLAEGGNKTMELQDAFWGARFGMLTDKFGINWMFNCELGKEEQGN